MRASAGRQSIARAAAAARGWSPARVDLTAIGLAVSAALVIEWEERRVFLWLPVAAGAGVLLYLAADREPVLWLPMLLLAGSVAAAILVRAKPLPFCLAVGAAALVGGFISAELRSRRVATPLLDRIRIVKLQGTVEEVDLRPVGARFILRLDGFGDLDQRHRPARVRLTTRRSDPLAAGQAVALTARLLPPSRSAYPGGYDFARDAYFSGLGAVGSVLGQTTATAASAPPSLARRGAMAVDRFRNGLAARVSAAVGGGDTGAVAAAMVTGKRDLLSADGREIIREAGIFHIITIAGVQMTLVAGLLFGGTRRLLACSRTLALRYPIKLWAAAVAIGGALAYDILTGSRIGTQRALFMTVIVLGAVLVGRRALTMRNLAFAALTVILLEPETIAGASFDLSFAAVAALIALQEHHARRDPVDPDPYAVPSRPEPRSADGLLRRIERLGRSGVRLLLATAFASAATASFMAADFHELSPYVLVGNPLTLTIIEVFAVPGALLGTVLYPLGLDAWVWQWVGLGIRIVMGAAGLLAAAPASTVHLRSFAPWALPCLALALCSCVIWQTALWRATAIPWLALGLLGAASGPRYDLVVAPTGEAAALRGSDGRLAIVGKGNSFTAEQWLRADGDAREVGLTVGPTLVPANGRCDDSGCVAPGPGGQVLSVVADRSAFEEDCRRADIIVTSLLVPASCAAPLVVDRSTLEETGALGFVYRNGAWIRDTARGLGEDRPWSPAPPLRRQARARPGVTGDGDTGLPADDADLARAP